MIVAGLCTSFKKELLEAVHDFTADTFKLALYTATADLDPVVITTYTSTGEVNATGYAAGGVTLSGTTVAIDQGQVVVDFADVVVPGTSMAFQGALVYNSSKANRAVAILDFGLQEDPATNPTVYMPAPVKDHAIIRL